MPPPNRKLPKPFSQAVLLVPDLEKLQEAQYEALPQYAAEYGRIKDETLPLWSICHLFKAGPATAITAKAVAIDESSWAPNWNNTASLYIYGGLTLSELSAYSGIPLRSIEARSGRLGWKQAARTYRLMKESESTPDLKDLEETVRHKTINEFLTQSGFEVGRHALQALLQHADQIEARDVPGLMTAAMKLLSMGEKIPSEYRFSKVDNPQKGAEAPNINILNITPERAEELIESLSKRKAVLDAALPEKIP